MCIANSFEITLYLKRQSRHSEKTLPGHCNPQGTTFTRKYLTTNKTWPRRRADKVTVNYQWHFRSYFLIYGYINFKGCFFSEAPVICDPFAGSKLNVYCCVVMCALCVYLPRSSPSSTKFTASLFPGGYSKPFSFSLA